MTLPHRGRGGSMRRSMIAQTALGRLATCEVPSGRGVRPHRALWFHAWRAARRPSSLLVVRVAVERSAHRQAPPEAPSSLAGPDELTSQRPHVEHYVRGLSEVKDAMRASSTTVDLAAAGRLAKGTRPTTSPRKAQPESSSRPMLLRSFETEARRKLACSSRRGSALPRK